MGMLRKYLRSHSPGAAIGGMLTVMVDLPLVLYAASRSSCRYKGSNVRNFNFGLGFGWECVRAYGSGKKLRWGI